MADLRYEISILADTEEVFAALTNPFQIEIWSGYPAKMSIDEGFEFSLWDGDICGKNIKVINNKLLIQEWYFGEQDNDSIVEIKLSKKGKETIVYLSHTNIPEEAYKEIVEGWQEYYLGSIKRMLEIY